MIRKKTKTTYFIAEDGTPFVESYGGCHPFLNLEDVPNPEDYEQVEEGAPFVYHPIANSYWWMSFADPKLPEGSQFLGVAIVEAPDFMMAVMQTKVLNINPGGEIQGAEVPSKNTQFVKDWMNRLLSREELEEMEKQFDGE